MWRNGWKERTLRALQEVASILDNLSNTDPSRDTTYRSNGFTSSRGRWIGPDAGRSKLSRFPRPLRLRLAWPHKVVIRAGRNLHHGENDAESNHDRQEGSRGVSRSALPTLPCWRLIAPVGSSKHEHQQQWISKPSEKSLFLAL